MRRAPHHRSRPDGDRPDPPEEGPGARLGMRTLLAVLAFYALAVVVATYPRVTMLSDTLPGARVDPLQHMWVMNWYRSCLAEGRPHVVCPDLQYPVGAPLANFSPMLFQTLLYLPAAWATGNDILAYNIVWFLGFVLSGLGVFALAWTVLRDRLGATFAGLAGMLSTPMMLRGHGHLELMYAGSMCLFLAAWVRWVDRPTRPGLLATVGLYVLASACAAYFAVLSVVPATLYVGWRLVGAGRSGAWPWLRRRAGWFAAFLALALPALLLIFSAQLWAVGRGISMHRPLSEYARYGSPIWGYALPTTLHPMSAVFPVNVYDTVGYPAIECAAYLGVVTMLLIGYAAGCRASFSRSRFWWLALGSLAVLSMGAYWRVGSHLLPLPGLWLREYVPIFRSIRAPARFNLLACGVAAVLAGAGLVALMGRFAGGRRRGVVFAAAVVLLVADMNMIPFRADTVRPAMPACYEWIGRRTPRAALLELPLFSSGAAHPLTATCGYWQSRHGMRTSAGYSGFLNAAFDDRMVDDSPMSANAFQDPEHLASPDAMTVGIVPGVAFADYAWMVAVRNRFDHILLHRWDEASNETLPAFSRMVDLLRGALVFEDESTFVFDVRKLRPPSRPTVLCEGGWRARRERPGPPMRAVERVGRIALYVPGPEQPVTLSMDARAHGGRRRVALRSGGATLARWEIRPGSEQTVTTPPIILPPGISTLVLESDGEARPRKFPEQAASWDTQPYSLLVSRLEVRPSGPGPGPISTSGDGRP